MKNKIIPIIIIIILTICSLIFSIIAILEWGNHDSFSDKYGVILSVLSTVVSLVALIYAMITYYSIDRVQSMNSMEGNVLCNPNYSVAYPENIQQFEKCKDENDFRNTLFEILFYKKPSNCQEYALGIQCIIDNITWIAWAEHDDVFYQHCEKLMKKLNKDKKRFRKVNSGLNLLIEENIKLIDSVIHYQNHRISNSTALCPMENIRGKVLENPLAKLTFYNYLGLEYLKRARDLLGMRDLYTSNGLQKARQCFENGSLNSIRGYYSALIEISKRSFKNAEQIAKDDLVWNGYISYNYARVCLMQYLIDPKSVGQTEMEQLLSAVVRKRENILFIIWKDNNQSLSFLHQKFFKELKAANELLEAFKDI